MKFKYTFVTIMIILLGGFFWSNGSDSDYPIPRKIDIEIDNFRGNCTSCSENYNPEDLGAVCCDQASEYFTCSELESNYNWICSGCECDSDPDFVSMYGCTDPSAANYSVDAIYDYGTCWYPELTAAGGVTEIALDWEPYGIICEDPTACTYGETLGGCVYAEENYDCDGNCIVEIDCVGECGGSAVVDECGVCDGNGAIYDCGCADMPAGDCDCNGSVNDCLGDCGGDAVLDPCGECDDDPSNDCFPQCEGEFDDCGMCTGGTTDLEYNYAMDCLSVCPGADGYIDAQEDVCGVCQGNGYEDWECNDSGSTCWDIADGDCDCAGHVDDCLGVCGGSAVEDACGVCNGGGKATCYFNDKQVCDLEECTIYYNVYRGEDGVDANVKIIEDMLGTEFTETGFEYINTFYYNVTYIDGWGHESPYSNTAAARPIVFPDFTYSPSTIPMAYSFGSIKLLDLGDIDIITTDDWVGAFNGDVCVGKMQITASTALSNCGLVDCATMYLYGDDGSAASSGYMSAGDIPSFKIWDGSTNNYYGTDNPTSDCLEFEGEGACCSDLLAADIFGCMDSESCTYDSDATVDDGSCLYYDCTYDPDDDSTWPDACGGTAVVSDFYYDIDGDGLGAGSSVSLCDANVPPGMVANNDDSDDACFSNVHDCFGECDGSAYIDNCGDCVGGSTGIDPCVQDCAGEWGGDAYIDNCGDCVGGSTGLDPCVQDCNEEWGGTAEVDECGDCGGDGPGDYSCNEIPVGFAYNQSMLQAFYLVGNAYDALGNTLVENEDWVGVFKVTDSTTTCVGSTKWEGENTTIAVMGDDVYGYTEGYMLPGETPTFIVFDGSAESEFTVFPYIVDGDLEFSLNNWVSMELLLPEYSDFERALNAGANLVSSYVLPLDSAIGNVFESVSDCVELVITEGSAAYYNMDGNEEWIGSLQYIDPEKGYWILVNNPDTLSFVGFKYNPSFEYTLHPGANLISFPAQDTYGLEASIPDVVEYLFEAIICEGSAAMNTGNGWVGSLTSFDGGAGYWVIVSEDLSFSYNLDDGIGRTIDVYSETMPTFGEFKVNQSTEQAFYFVDEITLLDGNVEAGDWLLSYNDNVLTYGNSCTC